MTRFIVPKQDELSFSNRTFFFVAKQHILSFPIRTFVVLKKDILSCPYRTVFPSPEELSTFTVHHGVGCRTCNSTGHKGRIAVYEIMTMSDELSEFVLNGASTLELKREAIRQGMKTLRMSGLTKLAEGVTSMKEVVRATAGD